MRNHYLVLGVGQGADDVEIKEAWRQACRRRHTDAGGDPEAFMQAREAFEVLSDPVRRRRHDAELAGRTAETRAEVARPDVAGDLEAVLGHAPTARQRAGMRLLRRASDLLDRLKGGR